MSDKNKTRTSITIDPDLLVRSRDYCAQASKRTGRKVSFSEIVSLALGNYIGATEEQSNV